MEQGCSRLRRFDFWVLLASVLLILFAQYVQIVGLRLLQRHSSWSTIYFAAIVLVIAFTLAWTASILPRREGLPVLPIIEAWTTREEHRGAKRSLIVGAGIGVAHFLATFPYGILLRYYFGSAHPKVHLRLDVLGTAGQIVFEEILFRGALRPVVIFAIRWIWETPITSGQSPFWIANILQASLFGLEHQAFYTQLVVVPWPIRLFLYAQTWSGLLYGWLYRKYGLEVPIVAHGTFDFLILLAIPFFHHAAAIRSV